MTALNDPVTSTGKSFSGTGKQPSFVFPGENTKKLVLGCICSQMTQKANQISYILKKLHGFHSVSFTMSPKILKSKFYRPAVHCKHLEAIISHSPIIAKADDGNGSTQSQSL